MKTYRHIFFDLDGTLWDFERCANETFVEMYAKYRLAEAGIPSFDELHKVYKRINPGLWDQYRQGEITKEFLNHQRFHRSFLEFGLDDSVLSHRFSEDYINTLPEKSYLYDHAVEILEYLRGRYGIHIITNGFEEVQLRKVRNDNIGKYFDTFTTSEEAGVKKPYPEIFEFALNKADARSEDSLMIGDDLEVDVKGAQAAGIDQVFFNHSGMVHQEHPTYEIDRLAGIEKIL